MRANFQSLAEKFSTLDERDNRAFISFYEQNTDEIRDLKDFETDEELYLAVVTNHTYGRSQLYENKNLAKAEEFLNIAKTLVLEHKDEFEIELNKDIWYLQTLQHSIYSLHSSASFNFSFHMTNGEFMFTKNFNSRVNCSFQPSAASLVAPDSATANDLLAFAQYGFDLSELYARRFRQRLFEEKGAFSNVSFITPIYDEVQEELAERHTLAGRLTDIGRNKEQLKSLHEQVLAEIQQLADFCKTCKPPKKRKPGR